MTVHIPFQPDEGIILVAALARSLNAEYDQRCRKDADDPKLDELSDLEDEAVSYVARATATTPQGLAAKAALLRVRLPLMTSKGEPRADLHTDDALTLSLVRDIIAAAEPAPQ